MWSTTDSLPESITIVRICGKKEEEKTEQAHNLFSKCLLGTLGASLFIRYLCLKVPHQAFSLFRVYNA